MPRPQDGRVVSTKIASGKTGTVHIVCHIVPPDRREVLIVSLTHVHIPRSMPFAPAVADYQKYRVKKLKKQSYN